MVAHIHEIVAGFIYDMQIYDKICVLRAQIELAQQLGYAAFE
jgi:hypothetical protein